MGYRVGQISGKGDISNYVTPVELLETTTITTHGIQNQEFTTDLALRASFQSGTKYSIILKVQKRVSPFTISTIGLFTSKNGDEVGQTISSDVVIDEQIVGFNTNYQVISLNFTAEDNFEYLGFICKRTTIDYIYGEVVYMPAASIEILSFYELKNLLPQKVENIGIQAEPGMRFMVNNANLLIGRSGAAEIGWANIDITFVGVIPQTDELKPFLIDYSYID